MKTLYYYVFYRIYKLVTIGEVSWLPVFRTSLFLIALESLLLFSILGYLSLLFGKEFMPSSPISIPMILFFLVSVRVKYIFFDKDESWKEYYKNFESWSTKKQTLGIVFFIFFIFLLILGFVFMLYLTGKDSGTI